MKPLPEARVSHLVETATKNIKDIVSIAIERKETEKILVVYDTESGLAQILLQAYQAIFPDATFLNFQTQNKEVVTEAFDSLSPKDLVVLIQSTDFRLSEFRIRIYLFQKQLKVIDHLHLIRNTQESWKTYVDALAYDPKWYRVVGPKLKEILQHTDTLTVRSETTTLTVTGGLEVPKLNIGDYTDIQNIGGTFPIGEVFTEAKDLHKMNGSLMIYAFAGADFTISMYEPFRIDIEQGLLVGWSETTPQSFIDIVEQVKAHERVIIREIGFGLNRAITREHYLNDVTAFERTHGMHFSLGEKHTVYKKEGIKTDKTRFHIDLFPTVSQVQADRQTVFENNVYLP